MITLHDLTLHYITLQEHYIIQHSYNIQITLQYDYSYSTLHYITRTFHHIHSYTITIRLQSHYITLHHITLHEVTLQEYHITFY